MGKEINILVVWQLKKETCGFISSFLVETGWPTFPNCKKVSSLWIRKKKVVSCPGVIYVLSDPGSLHLWFLLHIASKSRGAEAGHIFVDVYTFKLWVNLCIVLNPIVLTWVKIPLDPGFTALVFIAYCFQLKRYRGGSYRCTFWSWADFYILLNSIVLF